MLDQFKRLGKHSVIYGISGILNAALSFILTPLYATYLEPEDFGILAILTITASFIATLFQLGTGTAIFRSVIQREVNKRVVLSTAFYFTLGTIGIGLSIYLYLANRISQLLFHNLPNGQTLLMVVLFTAAFDSITAVPFAKLRIEERSVLYTLISGLNFSVGLILNVYFVAVLRLDVLGVVSANLIRAFIFAGVMTGIILPDLKRIFSILVLRELLHFGLPLVPISISALILAASDRYFLRYYTSFSEVGVYSLGYKVGSLIQLPITALQVAWPTILFSVSKTVHAKRFYALILTYYLLIIGYFAFIISLFAREIVIIISDTSYIEAWRLVPLIAASQVAFGIIFVTAVGVNLEKKPEQIMYAWLFGVAVHLILNFILISRYGMYGAAVSTLISYTVVAVGATRASLILYPIPYQINRLIKLSLIFGGIYLLSLPISMIVSSIQVIILKLSLILAVPLLIWSVGFFTPEETTIIRSLYRTLILHQAE